MRSFLFSSSGSDDSAAELTSSAAARPQSPVEKTAFGKMGEILNDRTRAFQALAVRDSDGLIDAAQYLRSLLLAVDRSGADQVKAQLTISTDPLSLQSERCSRFVLVVNQLLMSAFYQACLGGREGKIAIELTREDGLAHCMVSDDGAEMAGARPMTDLNTAQDLAQSLGGRIGHWFDDKGTSLVVTFPLTKRELQANRACRDANSAR